MKKTDNRKLSPEAQFKLRKELIRLKLQGKSNREISEAVGYCYSHISTIWRRYTAGDYDLDAPKPKVRGRRIGNKRKLTAEQEVVIKNLLIDNSPAQLGLNCASWLWTSETIRLLIRQNLKIDMPLRTVSDYRKRWGFTPKKPTELASMQDEKLLRHWLITEYKEIIGRIYKEKAEIHWFNCSDINRGSENREVSAITDDADQEQINIKKSHIKMLSTITRRGKFRFMLYRDSVAPRNYYMFLERLTKDCKSKVFLILYNHQVFYSEILNHFFNSSKNKPDIEFFFLPSNLPEHNPVEVTPPKITMGLLIKEKDKIRSIIAKNMPRHKVSEQLASNQNDSSKDRKKYRSENMVMFRRAKRK